MLRTEWYKDALVLVQLKKLLRKAKATLFKRKKYYKENKL